MTLSFPWCSVWAGRVTLAGGSEFSLPVRVGMSLAFCSFLLRDAHADSVLHSVLHTALWRMQEEALLGSSGVTRLTPRAQARISSVITNDNEDATRRERPG